MQNSDEKFLNNIKKAVEENMSDVEFSVIKLCELMGVRNSMLYRKNKSLIGITPVDFIKQIRFVKAAKLLDEKSLSISEIAYACGFNDISYFGACFKKQYGVPPSLYGKVS